ncbi:MAG: hypothetical protein GY953_48030 [bacterium]|nr:hypothetical protein [bacterium]
MKPDPLVISTITACWQRPEAVLQAAGSPIKSEPLQALVHRQIAPIHVLSGLRNMTKIGIWLTANNQNLTPPAKSQAAGLAKRYTLGSRQEMIIQITWWRLFWNGVAGGPWEG